MAEVSDSLKITYVKNLEKYNFNMTMSVPIDANVTIKKILNLDSYIFDDRVECGNSKAVYTGKLGVKILYVDADNIVGTITDSQSFSETILDPSITADCFISNIGYNIQNNIISYEGSVKISFEITTSNMLYLNMPISNNCANFENMIVKKSEINTYSINDQINTNFEYSVNMECKDNLSKILSYNAYFAPTNVVSDNQFAIVEGKIYSTLVCEVIRGEETQIVELSEVNNLKQEINLERLDKDCVLDLNFSLDKSKEQITSEIEDDTNIITIVHNIKVTGVSMKTISIDVVDDMYSVDNEIDLTLNTREFNKSVECTNFSDTISGEIKFDASDPAIDEILCNTCVCAEITNHYIKDGNLYFEGLVTSNLIYIDENKERTNKTLELPFVLNSKIKMETLECAHHTITVTDCKVKSKRGTIVEVQYGINISVCVFVPSSKTMVDNISVGKSIDYGDIDYQIFLAKPNETIWELSKRIKIHPDDLAKYNKNLPLVMTGNEKIVIKR